MLDFIINSYNAIQSSLIEGDFKVILLLGMMIVLGTAGARIFQRLKIPQVVGYIVIGILLGQSGLKIISTQSIKDLLPFSNFALAIIGFSIGGELKIKILKKFGKQFTYILLFEALTTFVVVTSIITLILFAIFKDFNTALAIGLILGAISSATAPAATTDVLWENKTRGPLTSTVLGIVAMDDGIALILFAIVTSAASTLLANPSPESISFMEQATNTQNLVVASNIVTPHLLVSILHIIYEIGMAIVIGSFLGFLLSKVIREYLKEDKILAFSLGTLLLLIGLCSWLKVDMILAAMSMGFFVSNFAPRRSQATFKIVENFAPPIYVLFFVLVGAKLNIWNINYIIALIAILFLTGRTIGKFLGAIAGSKLSRAPKTVQKYLPFCLFSQAGVAVGLSIVAGDMFEGTIGDIIVMVISTTTFVVQIVGPSFVKYAVKKSGEIGLNVTEEDLIQMTIASEVLNSTTPSIEENRTLSYVLEQYSLYDSLVFPVVNAQNKFTGVITIEEVKEAFMAYELSSFLLAHDFLIEAPYTCKPETPMTEVYKIMKKFHIDYVPVVDNENNLHGIIEQRAVQKLFTKRILELKNRAKEMED